MKVRRVIGRVMTVVLVFAEDVVTLICQFVVTVEEVKKYQNCL